MRIRLKKPLCLGHSPRSHLMNRLLLAERCHCCCCCHHCRHCYHFRSRRCRVMQLSHTDSASNSVSSIVVLFHYQHCCAMFVRADASLLLSNHYRYTVRVGVSLCVSLSLSLSLSLPLPPSLSLSLSLSLSRSLAEVAVGYQNGWAALGCGWNECLYRSFQIRQL